VTQRACTVDFAADHTDVDVSKDWYYLIPMPGICGFTDHVRYVYAFKLAGAKAEYHDTEIQEVPVGLDRDRKPDPDLYRGTISISKDKKRVIVRLREVGGDQKLYRFELNGTYHYH
jgi:hypothetical protein